MARSALTRAYRCWNDCDWGGCPGHTATLEFQSTSETLTYDNGQTKHHKTMVFQLVEFEAIMEMLVEFAEFRTEIRSLLAIRPVDP